MADFLDNTPEKADPLRVERAFLVGIQTSDMASGEAEDLLAELKELVENLGIGVVGSTIVNLRKPTPATLVGKGKVDEIMGQARMLECDVIVFDEGLTPAQQRNWEHDSKITVIDRQEVILDVFADRAHTREAVLQVALARMEYSLPRLTRAWTHLSRQRGKGNLGGEGETQLEQDRRIVRQRITRLKRELTEVRQHRGVQRQKRRRVPVPTSAIVGYTNAGKSSLLNAMTGASVLAEDKLFATLDPTTRQLILPGNQKLLLTDTVMVFNKIDIATPDQIARARQINPDALFLSAHSQEGIAALADHCNDLIRDRFGGATLLVPHDRYDVIARLRQVGHVQQEEPLEEGVRLVGRFPPSQSGFFAPYLISD